MIPNPLEAAVFASICINQFNVVVVAGIIVVFVNGVPSIVTTTLVELRLNSAV